MSTTDILLKLHKPAVEWFDDWKSVTFWKDPPEQKANEDEYSYRERVGNEIRQMAVRNIANKIDHECS